MIDRYTKIVLTIIAASLVALVMQNGVQMALAQVSYNDACGTPTHPVCQVSWSTPMPVRSVPVAGRRDLHAARRPGRARALHRPTSFIARS